MGLAPRISTFWAHMKLDKTLFSSRASIARAVVALLLFSFFAYLLWLPVFYLIGVLHGLSSHHKQPLIIKPGEDAIKHFAGSRDCSISQSDIYLAPWPLNPKLSPFCRNRATLLAALSGGGRHGFDEPFVGKGCTYRWFSTPEVCMILERFNTIVFVGDEIAQSIYTAFNILLREDLALGGLQQWIMIDQDRKNCKCDNQFLNVDCFGYAIKNRDEVKKNEIDGDRKRSPYFCERVAHAYVRVESVPAPNSAQTNFKDLTYLRPNPWQPSPLIFSFSHGSSFNTATTTRALEEWYALASGAERNIPMLFLGPPAFGLNKALGTAPKEGNTAVWQYQQEMLGIARNNHFDVLSLYNLTVQASTPDGEHFGEKVALVEAMMVINWLSKLDTS